MNDIKLNEKEQLKQELKAETDGERKLEIKYLIQRMVNINNIL